MLVLPDTSIWIDFLRSGKGAIKELLPVDRVLMHEGVIGELAMGSIKNRHTFLDHIDALPRAKSAHHDEVVSLVDTRRLFGRGLGWLDAHLLASALLNQCRLWTRDQALAAAAADLGLGWSPLS